MLVLTRKLNESLIVGQSGDVQIKVLELRRGFVRLGIAAPKDMAVHREEIFLRIQEENNQTTVSERARCTEQGEK